MERISRDDVEREALHRVRYHVAAGFLQPGDTVLDAACGIGYGADILCAHDDIHYIGVDRAPVFHPDYQRPDREYRLYDLDNLSHFHFTPKFDVSVSFETIEHLQHPKRFVHFLCASTERTIVASVPTIPSKWFNEFHLHDFERGDLPELFYAHGWHCVDILDQAGESCAIYIFQPA